MIKLIDISKTDIGAKATYRIIHSNERTVLEEDLVVHVSEFGKIEARLVVDCSISQDLDGTLDKMAERLERLAIALRARRETVAVIPVFGSTQ